MLKLVIFVLGSATAAIAQAQLPTRFTIHTFNVTPASQVADQITMWNNLLNEDIKALVRESRVLSQGERIQFSERRQPSTPSTQTVQRRWRELNAIQVITAIGFQNASSTAFEGSIYLGALGVGLPGHTVPLPPSLNASSYSESRNIVKAATLYALAVDAGSNRPAACRLLQRASQVERDLAHRNSSPASLRNAIDQRRSNLHCGIVR